MKIAPFRVLLPLLLAVPFVLGASAALALKGGWGVATFHGLPDHLTAGEPFELSFTVRAHGVTPVQGLVAEIRATSPGAGEIRARVEPRDGLGRYRASVTVPSAGEWTFTLLSSHTLVPLVVNAKLLPIQAVEAGDGAAPAPLSARERGRRLFVASGCVGCHADDAFRAMGYTSVPVGPSLTGREFPEAYLARLLADPQSVRSPEAGPWRMPKLELGEAEIAALIAFLNGQE